MFGLDQNLSVVIQIYIQSLRKTITLVFLNLSFVFKESELKMGRLRKYLA